MGADKRSFRRVRLLIRGKRRRSFRGYPGRRRMAKAAFGNDGSARPENAAAGDRGGGCCAPRFVRSAPFRRRFPVSAASGPGDNRPVRSFRPGGGVPRRPAPRTGLVPLLLRCPRLRPRMPCGKNARGRNRPRRDRPDCSLIYYALTVKFPLTSFFGEGFSLCTQELSALWVSYTEYDLLF
jgi:hypothetical protein